MGGFDTFDWDNAPVKQAVAMVSLGSTEQIDTLARSYNWKADPIQVMAAILTRPDCPLGTALAIFLRCAPGAMRGADASGACKNDLRLAEIIETAVNAGRFRHDPGFGLDDHARMMVAAYVGTPGQPRGRDWALDRDIVAPLLDRPKPAARPARGVIEGAFAGLAAMLRPRRRT